MYLLDTTFLIDLVKGLPSAITKAQYIDRTRQIAFISVVTVIEYLRGVHYLFTDNPDTLSKRLAKAESDLGRFEIIPIDVHIARIAAKISAQMKRDGQPIGLADVLIAATAMREDLTILTRNVSHFSRIQNVRIETY